ncbi:MAG: hypothetical protein ACX93I_07805 [Winogradskyella sp.]
MIKKSVFIFLSLTLMVSCKSQINSDGNVKTLMNEINNESIIMKVGYVTTFELDNNSKKILDLDESNRIDIHLLDGLKNKNKVLICHVLLTKLLEPDKYILKYKYNRDSDNEIESIVYTINNFNWVTNDDYTKNEILDYNEPELYNYWLKKVKK